MNAPKNMDKEAAQTPIFDPFPEPRTYPSGWDLSGFESPSSLPSAEPAGDAAES